MPKINLSFSGWVNSANISKAYRVATNEDVDVSDLTSVELVDKLQKGELALTLSDALDNCDNNEIDIFDYEAPLERWHDEPWFDEPLI